MAYITTADVATYLGTTLTVPQTAQAQQLINGYSSALEVACNRTWDTNGNQTETFDGGSSHLFPKHVPIATVVSLTDNNSALVQDDDFFIYDTYIALAQTPSAGNQSLTLVYTASDAFPASLKQVLIRWVAQGMQNASSGLQAPVNRLTQGPVTVEYSTDTASSSSLPEYVMEVVRLNRLHAI